MMKTADKATKLLSQAGITINGSNPWDPQIKDQRLYDRIFGGGTLAMGESYMDGWWEVADLSGFIYRVFRGASLLNFLGVGIVFQIVRSKFFNLQNVHRAYEVGEKHYDIGNDLYQKMLGRQMAYSCGYWKKAKNLEEAQDHKFDLICKKIGLKKGDRILDVGCGWGGFARFAAEQYGASVVGLTVSKEQTALAKEYTEGLPVEIRLQDWRQLGGEKFDHIVSVGMFEHVGPKNYRAYMQKMSELLKDDGLFLLHTIGHSKTTRNLEPWFSKYIFPNGHVPSLAQITTAIDRSWFGDSIFIVEDLHNFGIDYDKTLVAWFDNFDKAWPELKADYDERFYRMWKYYLLVSAGMFRARYTELWQIVLSKRGVEGGYISVR
ncbi:cyclopropane-fatty-acyl-phospholipid synthase [Candidatus Adlerbacteria bacterium RIFCSPHIGHO2_02_FULL_54_18]|uniref:Cyclopropane-fatty-acyl-phospholipid synthase n=2 Tax=Candidatus Adleribacteriota TaxID=1752736 RepID=A0A1F4Y1X3_9BACT|nr:MAG: cyclopropane-fatty-acyl-phospholipid synthase [Candidatus Adlerbacteria bacterium RIFCSPLOWO2_01_FULL_54_21b]OGC87942.1 MAG: cyclopropane-fatty-acyl-phospholipid synthase [Candidatus Adlerbacteria bacterium RIFCSPHIGHO2_02_FULL_54_18]